jgi:phenylalanine-4-hydroxylase
LSAADRNLLKDVHEAQKLGLLPNKFPDKIVAAQ